MLISDDLIIIIVSNDGYIGIGAYNSNTENFNEGLISIKKARYNKFLCCILKSKFRFWKISNILIKF